MKLQFVLIGVLFCLAAQAAGQPGQSAPKATKAGPAAQRILTGCVDEQNGHYVLLDDQMLKITGLQSAGADADVFAKYLGNKVQAKGTRSSGQDSMFKVTSIERVAGNCGPAK
jgi:hypothetical protein